MSQPKKLTKEKEYENLGRMVATIYESGYLDKKQTLKMSFLKGLLGGLGGVIGATIVVALLLWVLSLFKDVPLVGRFTNNVQNTIQTRPAKR
jgi:uncharacterized membrane protein YfcA